MNIICPICKEEFTPGENGLLEPLGCDRCLGVERIDDPGSDASAWLPFERVHTYGWIGEEETITRKDARKWAVSV